MKNNIYKIYNKMISKGSPVCGIGSVGIGEYLGIGIGEYLGIGIVGNFGIGAALRICKMYYRTFNNWL